MAHIDFPFDQFFAQLPKILDELKRAGAGHGNPSAQHMLQEIHRFEKAAIDFQQAIANHAKPVIYNDPVFFRNIRIVQHGMLKKEEPSMGVHEMDGKKLIETAKRLG